jgi:hypothetical protein
MKVTSRHLFAMLAVASGLGLSSCGSIYPSGDHMPRWGQPQQAGWTVSPQVREAERKSITKDMPYASVTASGSIVQVRPPVY